MKIEKKIIYVTTRYFLYRVRNRIEYPRTVVLTRRVYNDVRLARLQLYGSSDIDIELGTDHERARGRPFYHRLSIDRARARARQPSSFAKHARVLAGDAVGMADFTIRTKPRLPCTGLIMFRKSVFFFCHYCYCYLDNLPSFVVHISK